MTPLKLLYILLPFAFWFSFFALGAVCVGVYLISPVTNLFPLLVVDGILFVASIFATAIASDELKK